MFYFEDDNFGKSFSKHFGNSFPLKIHEFGSSEIKIVSSINLDRPGDRKEALFIYSPLIEKQPCRDFKILLSLNYLTEYFEEISLFSPYLSNSRQDKKTPGKEEGIALKHWLYLLKASGVKRLTSVDIHSNRTKELSEKLSINFVNIPHSAVFKEVLRDRQIDIIIAPDKGAEQRAKALSSILNKPHITLEKKRDYERGGIEKVIYEGPPLENKRALIVDDIISSGATIVRVLETLKLKKAILAITHQTLNKRGFSNLDYLHSNGYISEAFFTNSIPLKERREFIKVVDLSLSDEVVRLLKGI